MKINNASSLTFLILFLLFLPACMEQQGEKQELVYSLYTDIEKQSDRLERSLSMDDESFKAESLSALTEIRASIARFDAARDTISATFDENFLRILNLLGNRSETLHDSLMFRIPEDVNYNNGRSSIKSYRSDLEQFLSEIE